MRAQSLALLRYYQAAPCAFLATSVNVFGYVESAALRPPSSSRDAITSPAEATAVTTSPSVHFRSITPLRSDGSVLRPVAHTCTQHGQAHTFASYSLHLCSVLHTYSEAQWQHAYTAWDALQSVAACKVRVCVYVPHSNTCVCVCVCHLDRLSTWQRPQWTLSAHSQSSSQPPVRAHNTQHTHSVTDCLRYTAML